ncbi:hypothetical protein BGX38DRAFT_1270499 [Terfezia claveryi]|nr:hypothetical protein BGX38DRAFT_1270499 [Terfezia claveryi]
MTASVFTKRNLKGLQLHFPGSPEYERSVATGNLEYRYETPLFVATPTHISHVTAVVELANKLGKKLTMKGGGHSFGGFSNSLDGILLDMSRMRKVELDISQETVTLQPGALWGNAYRLLVDNQINNYTIMGGRCPDVGVAGFTMGGGLCVFTRSYGMGIDQLKEATLVTVNEEGIVEVHTVTENDTDTKKKALFWAIRGCGGGNYGVLVEMKMKVQKLFDNEGRVTSGQLVLRAASDGNAAVRRLIDSIKPLHTVQLPDALTIDSIWDCDTSVQSPLTINLPIYYNGNKIEYERDLTYHLPASELTTQLSRAAIEEKYSLFLQETLPNQFRDDMLRFCPLNKTYNLNSSFIFTNDIVTIDKIAEVMEELIRRFRDDFLGSKSILELKLIHGGGKANDVGTDETAFAWRTGVYFGHIMVQWTDRVLGKQMKEFFERCKEKLMPHSLEGKAAFINFTDRTFKEGEYPYAYYGVHYERLQEVKEMWDPLDTFQFAQSIRLPGTPVFEPSLRTQELGEFSQSLEDINSRWDRYVQPDIGFDELVGIEGHSCASCSTKWESIAIFLRKQ